MEQLAESAPASRPNLARAQWTMDGLAHGFYGRIGGVSCGPFATLNFSYFVGDDAESVDRNWSVARQAMPSGARIARLNQVHGATVQTVGADFSGARSEGDGLVTDSPAIMLTILTADCVPVLMVDAERRVVAALHAGWRGTLAGIAAAGVSAMAAMGARPERIGAALGPSIGACCFEVDQDLAARFGVRFAGAERHSRAGRAGKAYLNLRGLIRDELQRCGLEPGAIASVGPCTRCGNDRYFSRRAAGGNITGLQLSYIGFDDRVRP
jgi:polyphenol oxidase